MPAGSPRTTFVAAELLSAEDGVVTVEARSLDFEPLLQIFRVSPGGAATLLAGARHDPLRATSRVRVAVSGGSAYRVEVRPTFEDWGGEIELSVLSAEVEPLPPVAPEAYWGDVAAGARESRDALQEARSALGRLHPAPLRPQHRFLEILPPLEETLYFRLQAASAWWQPWQRRMRVRSWLLVELQDQQQEYARALSVYERLLGAGHPATGDALLRRGAALLEARSLLAAQDLLVRAHEITVSSLGADHPQTAQTEILLGRLFRQMGDHRQAASLFEHALAVTEKSFGPESVVASYILEDMAVLRWQMEDYEGARGSMERALMLGKRLLGADHPRTVKLFRELMMLAAWSWSGDPLPVSLFLPVPHPREWPAGESLVRLAEEYPAVLSAARESAFHADLFGTLWSKWFAKVIFWVEREQALMHIRFRLESLLRECEKNPAAMMACGDDLLLWNERSDAARMYRTSVYSLIGRSVLPPVRARFEVDDPRFADSLREGALDEIRFRAAAEEADAVVGITCKVRKIDGWTACTGQSVRWAVLDAAQGP